MNNILLRCTECDYQEVSQADKEFMHKIIVWNHVQKVHPETAERILRIYETVPNNLFDTRPAEAVHA